MLRALLTEALIPPTSVVPVNPWNYAGPCWAHGAFHDPMQSQCCNWSLQNFVLQHIMKILAYFKKKCMHWGLVLGFFWMFMILLVNYNSRLERINMWQGTDDLWETAPSHTWAKPVSASIVYRSCIRSKTLPTVLAWVISQDMILYLVFYILSCLK